MIIDKIAEKIVRKLFPRVVASIENAAITNLSERIDARLAELYPEFTSVRSALAHLDGQYVVRNRINGAFATYEDDPYKRVYIDKTIAESAIAIGILQRCDGVDSDRVEAFYVDLHYYLP